MRCDQLCAVQAESVYIPFIPQATLQSCHLLNVMFQVSQLEEIMLCVH